jgi:hypothetical protein
MTTSTDATEMSKLVVSLMRERPITPQGFSSATCPFCEDVLGTPDRKQSLRLKHETGYWWCYRCGTTGYIDGVVRPATRQRTSKPVPVAGLPPEAEPMWDREVMAARSYGLARRFLLQRGVTPSMWKAYRIHAAMTGRYARMVLLPRMSDDLKWYDGFVARSIEGKTYLYPEGMSRQRFYLEHRLAKKTREPVLVVEGAFDAIPYRTTIACFGQPIPDLVEKLVASDRPVVLCLDGDAWRNAMVVMWEIRMRRQLRENRSPTAWLRLPPGCDPEDLARVDPRAMPLAAKICLHATEDPAYPPAWRAADFTVQTVRRWGEQLVPENDDRAWLDQLCANLPEAV